MKYKIMGTVLKDEEKIEYLLNLSLPKFDQEIKKLSDDELKKLLGAVFNVLGRLKNIKINVDEEENIERIIKLRLD